MLRKLLFGAAMIAAVSASAQQFNLSSAPMKVKANAAGDTIAYSGDQQWIGFLGTQTQKYYIWGTHQMETYDQCIGVAAGTGANSLVGKTIIGLRFFSVDPAPQTDFKVWMTKKLPTDNSFDITFENVDKANVSGLTSDGYLQFTEVAFNKTYTFTDADADAGVFAGYSFTVNDTVKSKYGKKPVVFEKNNDKDTTGVWLARFSQSTKGQWTDYVGKALGNVGIQLLVGTATGVKDVNDFTEAKVIAYNGNLNVFAGSNDLNKVEIYSADGKLVATKSFYGNAGIPTNGLKGIYMVRINNGKKVVVKKVVL